MTKIFLFLLTIFVAFFKLGESAQMMMSIYGDNGFLFHSADLAVDELVGFVYDDADGGFVFGNCTVNAKTNFQVKEDCTVTAVTVVDADAASKTEANSMREESLTNFPGTATTNVMVAQLATERILAKTLTQLDSVIDLPIIQAFLNVISSSTADDTASTYLCNTKTKAQSDALFVVDTTSGTSNFGIIKTVIAQKANYLPVTKCLAAVRNTDSTSLAIATFILVVSDHASINGRFNSLGFISVVALAESINNTATVGTTVGYINGIDACPSDDNFTVTPASSTGTPCKSKITTKALGSASYLAITYDGTKYILPVMMGETTTSNCTANATSAATADATAFAFNFKYSNILIGMLLMFMLKKCKSY